MEMSARPKKGIVDISDGCSSIGDAPPVCGDGKPNLGSYSERGPDDAQGILELECHGAIGIRRYEQELGESFWAADLVGDAAHPLIAGAILESCVHGNELGVEVGVGAYAETREHVGERFHVDDEGFLCAGVGSASAPSDESVAVERAGFEGSVLLRIAALDDHPIVLVILKPVEFLGRLDAGFEVGLFQHVLIRGVDVGLEVFLDLLI